jgi:FkbM family methyltransferase
VNSIFYAAHSYYTIYLGLKMKNWLKAKVRAILKIFSLELHWISPSANPMKQTCLALRLQNIDVVLDIGANIGQFASELRLSGYFGEIISFEPLSSAHDKLCKNSAHDPKWKIHEQSAIGDFIGNIAINIAKNSVSSSALPMLESHSRAAPESGYVGNEIVPIVTLDSIVMSYVDVNSKIFIKIDTQGFEWQVLDGAKNTLKLAQGVLCELSLVPLYENQHLWREIVDRLESEGFIFWAIQKGFTDPYTGRSLQFDAIFLRA